MKGWATAALGDVAAIERVGVDPKLIADGSLYVGLENIRTGGGLVDVVPVGRGDLASTKFRFARAHVLFGKLRPYLAKVARPDFDGICSTDILPIRPGPALDRDYLAHFLLRPESVAWAASRSAGANLPRLSPDSLTQMRVPLPPVDEQRRLAALLDRANELGAARGAALAELDALAESIFEGMFGADVETRPNLRLESITSLITKGTTPTSVGYTFADRGIPFVRVQNLGSGVVDWDGDILFIDSPTHEALSRSQIRAGDVLVSIAGSIGRVATVPVQAPELNCNQAVAIIRPTERVLPEFLAHWLRGKSAQQQILGAQVTGTISNLSLTQLRELRLFVPEMPVQREFARRLAAVERVRARYRTSLAQLEALFATLQFRAFNGPA